ncbi:fimbria/pilus periplasmic chaperone [Escherichia coli]|nr:fimbria/pilus periplasmic chaperone [Escherichia coli]ELO3078822.1 fimbria/pilus periplasmic chaperone [Escherichia coli]
MQTTRTPYSISFMATVLLLLLFACHSTVANAAVALGATRVIYPANQKQVLLPVTNNDPASVYLIQSWIENAGDQKDTQFVITPPLFSMQGKKENTLRIINITVTNMKAGNSNLPNTMVPPKGEVSVDITHAATGDISFQTINDYGALTPRIKATMQ